MNIPLSTPETFQERLEKLRGYCEREERNFTEVKKSNFVWALLAREKETDRMVRDFANVLRVPAEEVRRIEPGFLGPPAGLIERIEGYVEAGTQHIILGFPKGWERPAMELFHDEVLSAIA